MSSPGPSRLGRSVVVNRGEAAPSAWAASPTVPIDEDTLTAPAVTVALLRDAWLNRKPVVIELGVAPEVLRRPQTIEVEPWTLSPDLRLWVDELQFLVWANSYDARGGIAEPVWWWGRKAMRFGARPVELTAAGDVSVGETAVWIDGGPRDSSLERVDGLPIVHRESVERSRLEFAKTASLVSNLAPDQSAAVTHARGPARIIAPAGSGKTRVLSERLRRLIVDCGWERDAIVAVAYNKKAQEQLDSRCGDFRPVTRTLNSLGLWVLTQSRGRQPQLLSERDVRRLVEKYAPAQRQRANTDPIGPYIEALSRVRLAMIDPEKVESERDDVPGLPAVFDGVRKEMIAAGAVDFDEQIYSAIETLLRDGELRCRLQRAGRHLLVDEFQDLAPAHVLLLRLIAGPSADVFGVGDDDQVIYGHAGADPAFLIEYDSLFPGAADHPLEVNYRCTPDTVAAASRLLAKNRRRIAKAIRSGVGDDGTSSESDTPPSDPAARVEQDCAPSIRTDRGFKVELHPTGDGATRVVEQVSGWLAAGVPAAEIAVLARVHAALLAPSVALAAAGLPLAGAMRADILERTGLRAALAYIRIAVAPDGGLASSDIVEVLRRPSRGLPPWFSDRVRRRSAWRAEGLASLNSSLSDRDAAKVDSLAQDLVGLRSEHRSGATTADLVAFIRDEIGLGGAMTLLDSSRGAEGSSHLDDLDALAEVALLHPDAASFELWLRALLDNPVASDGVTVSTVHRVKGMEWDRVAVYGVVSGLLPHRLAEDVEEERRVLHVAMTRGRMSTVLLADSGRASPFLAEIAGTRSSRGERTARRERFSATR